MSGPSIASLVLGTLAFLVGVYYLLYAILTGQRRENLAFSLTCFAAAVYDICSAQVYASATALRAGEWQRWEMIALDVIGALILWFVADYTGRRPGRIEYAFWGYWVLEIAMWLVNPLELTLTSRETSRTIEFLGLSVQYRERAPGILCHVGNGIMLLALLYILWRLIRYYRVDRVRAVPVLIGLVGLSAAMANDAAVNAGIHDFFYVLNHAYMFIIFCMAYSMLTAQIRTRAALRESQAELESIFRGAPTGIGVVADRVIVQVNDRVCEMTGYSRDELIGQSARMLYGSEEEFRRVGAELADKVRESGRGTAETRWVRKDGGVIDVLLGWAPLDGAKPSSSFSFTALDMTERKRAERALKDNERFLSNVFASIQDGLSILDTDLRIVRVNATMEQWYAHSRPLIGKKCYEAYHLRNEACEVCPSRRAMQTRRAAYDVVPKCGEGGKTVGWIDLFSFPLIEESTDKVIGVIEYVRDITERRKAEEEAHRLAAAVHAAAESIVITDDRERILYVNPSFERLTGYARQEVIGQRPSIVKSGKHDRAFYQRMRDTLMAGKVWSGHFTNRKKDGTLYEEEAVISPVRDDAGRIVNFVAVKRDVTQELLLENELRQSQKMEAIGRLAGRVAHDFTNLLVIIQGNAGLAKDRSAGNPEIGEFLDSIIDASNRACKLTSQLLAFSHRQPMILRKVDLGRTVLGLEEMLRRTLRPSIHLGVHAAGQPCPVRADPDHIEQVMVHLAINASDAMPEKGTLTVDASLAVLSRREAIQLRRERREEQRSEGAFGVLSVSDTGCGMPPEVLAHLFEPFFTTKGSMTSTGLGLSTVYGIVEQHEGAITVYSKPGVGTTFRVYLRLIGKAEQELMEKEKALEVPTGTGTILLVDDDPVSRGLKVGMCQSLGYSLLEAEDATQTLQLVAAYTGTIALLMVDYGLLKTSETDLIGEVRRRQPGIQVILTSGFPRSHLVDSGAIRETDAVLCRPYQRGVLARTLQAVLTGKAPGFTPPLRP